jgi:hypothetical protein
VEFIIALFVHSANDRTHVCAIGRMLIIMVMLEDGWKNMAILDIRALA